MTVLEFTNNKEWKLLEEKTINDRTIIVWYNPSVKTVNFVMFHLTDQPNEISKKSPHSHWGFVTFFVFNISYIKEASEVVSLYMQDLENGNYWWESIN